MAIATRKKDPNSTRKFTIKWARWLLSQGSGEVIANSEWIVPEGLNKLSEGFDTVSATIWISGGTDGAIYRVINRITTDDGQIQDATLEIIIKEQ